MSFIEGHKTPPLRLLKKSPEILLRQAEGALRFRENNKSLLVHADLLIRTLGGTPLAEAPINKIPSVIARLPSSLSTEIHFSVLDPEIDLNHFIHREHDLSTILNLKPNYPEFWEKHSNNGVVKEDAYSQNLAEDVLTDTFPNGMISVKEDRFQVMFLPYKGATLQWPLDDAEGLYGFDATPEVLFRAWKVYLNACDTRSLPPFFDMDQSHSRYKTNQYQKRADSRLGIEFLLPNPKHGRPVQI